jgi:hypothetical protein
MLTDEEKKERRREDNRQWRENNMEKFNESCANWRKKNKKKWNAIIKNQRQKTQGRKNSHKSYTEQQDELIMTKAYPDVQLAEMFDRSVSSIIGRRYYLKKTGKHEG